VARILAGGPGGVVGGPGGHDGDHDGDVVVMMMIMSMMMRKWSGEVRFCVFGQKSWFLAKKGGGTPPGALLLNP
jgi:hypothetical protein